MPGRRQDSMLALAASRLGIVEAQGFVAKSTTLKSSVEDYDGVSVASDSTSHRGRVGFVERSSSSIVTREKAASVAA
ncbi:hypothetical protein Pla8534_20500 [Lignipirellula cremea]|uniref:Uncharacterized protein n=1 Tax=Lignipirellula cremea TaxID=2528010 RepID=A0A518DR18_9BACT|nr:hypothetical protein Pla8534_20500 [Lignipirellula cremea]